MYEEAAPRKNGAFRDIFLIVLSAFLLLSLPNWIPFTIPMMKAVYEFLVFAAAAIAIFCFLKKYAVEYRYCLLGATLYIKGKTGARESVFLAVPLESVTHFSPLKDARASLKAIGWKIGRVSMGVSDRNDAYLLTYVENGMEKAVVFQPSNKFVELLQQIPLDKCEKI